MQDKKVFIVILLGITLLACGCFACGGYLTWNRLTFEPNQVNFPLEEKWIFEVGEEIETTPQVSGDYIVIRTRKGIYTLNATQGKLLWYVPFEDRYNNSVTNPVVHQNKVFVMKGDEMKALDLVTGNTVWRVSDDVYQRRMYIADATDKAVIFVKTNVVVRDTQTGDLLWEVIPDSLTPSVTVAKGQVHIFTRYKYLTYDLQSGELLSEMLTQGKQGYGGEYFGGQYFYIRGEEGLFAYDVQSKEMIWQRKDFNAIADPIYKFGDMLLLSDPYPIALDEREGRTLWHTREFTLREGYYTPVVVDYVVYVQSARTNRIYALNPANGEIIGYLERHVSTFDSVSQSPGPVQYKDGIIFAIDNYLYAYGP